MGSEVYAVRSGYDFHHIVSPSRAETGFLVQRNIDPPQVDHRVYGGGDGPTFLVQEPPVAKPMIEARRAYLSGSQPEMNDAKAAKEEALGWMADGALLVGTGGTAFFGRIGAKKTMTVMGDLLGVNAARAAFQVLRETAVTVKNGKLTFSDAKDLFLKRGELFKNVAAQLKIGKSTARSNVEAGFGELFQLNNLRMNLSIQAGEGRTRMFGPPPRELYLASLLSIDAVLADMDKGGPMSVNKLRAAWDDRHRLARGENTGQAMDGLLAEQKGQPVVHVREFRDTGAAQRRQKQAKMSPYVRMDDQELRQFYLLKEASLKAKVAEVLPEKRERYRHLVNVNRGYDLLLKYFK